MVKVGNPVLLVVAHLRHHVDRTEHFPERAQAGLGMIHVAVNMAHFAQVQVGDLALFFPLGRLDQIGGVGGVVGCRGAENA